MNRSERVLFNARWSEELFDSYRTRLEKQVGPIPFQLAETPFFISRELREFLFSSATAIVEELAEPKLLAELRKAVPERFFVRGEPALPDCAQVDFAVVQNPDGSFEGRVVELQAFPSLYAMMTLMADAWADELNAFPELAGSWTAFNGKTRAEALEQMRRVIVGDHDPREVVLVDLEPEEQKTVPDFVTTQLFFGVESCCITKIEREGRELYRRTAAGERVRIRRIYNRVVFDELEKKGVAAPFAWGDDLDVEWASHPNWYWIWSKYALPYVKHRAVPKATFVHELREVPANLGDYVLKPLFSFAGAGVILEPTAADLAAIPEEERSGWILQEKITYAHAFEAPDGGAVKAEIRVMLLRDAPGDLPKPLLCLVRLSRGKMLGVDFNKGFRFVGGSVGMWRD
jgi:hypothetical protein